LTFYRLILELTKYQPNQHACKLSCCKQNQKQEGPVFLLRQIFYIQTYPLLHLSFSKSSEQFVCHVLQITFLGHHTRVITKLF